MQDLSLNTAASLYPRVCNPDGLPRVHSFTSRACFGDGETLKLGAKKEKTTWPCVLSTCAGPRRG
ncbi:hypothetical protein PR003_g1351 [Phytophthora rubi]|uniref:Uncharacterized protein n=1 Tax=Phytophthora rubi TaxID=129364 RepID=A0A6A4G3R0_9STRA|nr:hypothetical protein PR002_g1317 [Phytophthora rubi]KAE9358352.1 hypothetical protein PR003_g1351 [Phytophthora rubi]